MRKISLFSLLSFLAVSLVFILPACAVTPTTSGSPTIVAFSASPTDITAGDSTTLLWNVTNATSIQIDQGVGSGLAAAGTISVSPGSDTTYTITASNGDLSATQSVTVTVAAATSTPTAPSTPMLPPNIVVFDISPNTIHTPPGPGPNKATIRWEVQNAVNVTLDGSPVPHADSKIVSPPLGTHTYTLRATNAYGVVTRTQVLHVVP